LPSAAVVAKARSIRYVPLAAVANHKSLPQAEIFPALPEYTPKHAKKLRRTQYLNLTAGLPALYLGLTTYDVETA